jgi:dolichol-phosphate mannosyltransferase
VKLSVIVPFCDEAGSLPRIATELAPVLDGLGLEYEIVGVNDGSRDDSRRVALALKEKLPALRLLEHPKNRGLGAAVRTGLAAAQGELIVTFEADFTCAPAQIAGLLIKQMETKADCVATTTVGSKDAPWLRRFGSQLVNRSYRLWAGPYTGWTPLFRLYRAEAVKPLTLKSEGFEINAEILISLLRAGGRIVEMPIELTARREGVSKLKVVRELRNHAALTLRMLLN